MILITTGGEQAAIWFETIQRTADEYGWSGDLLLASEGGEVVIAAEGGARIIAVDGPELVDYTVTIAGEYPQAYFIGLTAGRIEAETVPENMLIFASTAREDQVGFMGGVIAGLATQTRRVAVVSDPATAAGLKYRNGFLHGVRYTCPKCRVDFLDANEAAAAEAAKYAIYNTDVFYAAPGPDGEAALAAAASKGAWVIGASGDPYLTLFPTDTAPGAEQVLAGVYLDPPAALGHALAAYRAGTPLSGIYPLAAAVGAVTLTPYHDPLDALSDLDRADVAAALARLSDGSLETGIDPLTGEEK